MITTIVVLSIPYSSCIFGFAEGEKGNHHLSYLYYELLFKMQRNPKLDWPAVFTVCSSAIIAI